MVQAKLFLDRKRLDWPPLKPQGEAMRRAVKRFINYIRSERGLSPTTVQSYRDDLKKFIEYLESRWGRGLLLGDVTPEMIHEFLDFLAHTGYRKKNGAAARAKRLVSVRSFFRYVQRQGRMPDPLGDGQQADVLLDALGDED